jgi:hypothetical protein
MARSITITLQAGAGADLGPFNMSVSSGTITPTTATRAELLAGKVFTISSDSAVNVTATSTGTCTNSASVTISESVITSDCGAYSITDDGNTAQSTFQYYAYPSGTIVTSSVNFGQTINFQAYQSPAPTVTSGDAVIAGPLTCI